jgi:hypothetical protein
LVRRKRTLNGSDFVQGLVFGFLHQADASTEELAQILGRREIDISASGLCQRFSQAAAEFLERVLAEMVNESIQAEQPAPAELLGRFEAVIVEDSSTIKLPDKLKDVWAGCGGGQGQSQAGLKLPVRLRSQARWCARATFDRQSAGRSTQSPTPRGHCRRSAQYH